MAEAKDSKLTSDKAKKATQDKAVELVSGRRRRKRDSRTPYIVMAVIFVVILAALFFVILKRKPAGSAVAAKGKSAAKEGSRRSQKKAEGRSKIQKAEKPSSVTGSLAAEPPARRQRRADLSRGAKRRTPREKVSRQAPERGKKTRRAGGRGSTPKSWLVNGISEGTALIGGRAVRGGDVLRGRIIRDVGADYVRVEYGGATYSLRVGDQMP